MALTFRDVGENGGSSGVTHMQLADGSSDEDDNADRFDARGVRLRPMAGARARRPRPAAPASAAFETLADGSTALVLPAGARLRLCLKDLLGEVWKDRAADRPTPEAKRRP